MTFSDKVKKRVEARYYELASNNAAHFANPGQAGFGVAGFPPGSAGATYHEAHERAMVEAYKAGSRGSDISPAMEREAMAEHFLTDSFAAGHLSTRRTSITEYWNDKHPNFGDQFVKKVAHDMAVKLNDQSTGISGALTIGQFEDGALSIIREKLTGKPLPKLGDILAVTVHSYDNNRGLWVTNDVGWSWAAWGDSNLDPQGADQDAPPPHTNREVATLAVHMGIEDVSIAHSMGRRDAGALLPDLQLFDQVRQQVQAPAVPGEKYGPEQLMPRIDDRIDQGELGWQVDSLQTLWETRVRSNSPTTFGEYISNDMKPGGSMGDELEALYLGIDEEMDPIGSKWYGKAAEVIIPILMVAHGHVYPRRAFKESVLDQVRDKGPCLVFLLDVVSK
jgi:hypothetical protein